MCCSEDGKLVQDDITLWLSENNLSHIGDTVLKDIFGNDKECKQGIVYSISKDEYDAKVNVLCEQWDFLENGERSNSGRFSNYFQKNNQRDIREGMLRGLREYVGLGDSLFFNNAQECSNKKYKAKIKEDFAATSAGYASTKKVSFVKAIDMYDKYVRETRRNVERACIDKGPYSLVGEYAKLRMSEQQWDKMSSTDRREHIKKFDKFGQIFLDNKDD